MATGRIPEELSAEVFGDSTEGDHLAYSGTPTTRPHSLRTMPFLPIIRRITDTITSTRRNQANEVLRNQLRSDALQQRFAVILQQDNIGWNVHSSAFRSCVLQQGVVRDRSWEKVWDSREDGQLCASANWATTRHVFACCCNAEADSGVPVSATVENSTNASTDFDTNFPSSLLSQSLSSLSSDSSISSSNLVIPPRMTRVRHPLRCSQRAPFEDHEDIAYGLVKRWILVSQGKELNTVIAHVRIFFTSLEQVPDTGCPIIHQQSLPAFQDHYMLAKHIVCRITLSPLPNDTSRFLVSHVV
jgi:hypothetical protein